MEVRGTLPPLAALDARTLRVARAVPRGYRLPHERVGFEDERRERLTASLLPTWLGLGKSSLSRDRIVRILNANEGLFVVPSNDFTQPALDWGTEHEHVALKLYMEITRFPVALGSTRRRDRLPGEHASNENAHFSSGIDEPPWRWKDLLVATPDGFVVDQEVNRGAGGVGLLEIKCPYAPTPIIDGVPARHNVELPLRIESMDKNDTHALLLQAWGQLEVVQDAAFVDLVVYKRSLATHGASGVVPGRGHLWMARINRHPSHQSHIKAILARSFNAFASAMAAIEADHAIQSDPRTRGALERPVRAKAVNPSADGEWELSKANTLTRKERQAIRDAVDAWAADALCFRDAGDPEGGFPWVTKRQVEFDMRDASDLIRRYDAETGEVYSLSNDKYSICLHEGKPLTTRMLLDEEYIG
jgi:hypothetical protein